MNKPQFVTFTGVDDQTDFERLISLSNKYPIEWGVLIGGKIGLARYPTLETINKMSAISIAHTKVNCALHLCGVFAKEAQENCSIPPEIDITGYGRMQVNAINYNIDKLGEFALMHNKKVIFQHRKGQFATHLPPGVYPLHDESGGKGRLPSDRPVVPGDVLVGFAGGIGPDNVDQVITDIETVTFESQPTDRGFIPNYNLYWLDMETKVRTLDDRFSLDKCEEVCIAIWGVR